MPIAAKIIQPKFWIHVSEFEVSESADTVQNLVATCLGIGPEKIETFKLIPKDRDINSLRFISFKVGIPLEFKDIVNQSSTWPVGLSVRPFDTSRNFRSRGFINQRKNTIPSTTSNQIISNSVSLLTQHSSPATEKILTNQPIIL